MKFVCFLGVVLLAFCAQNVEALSLSNGFSSNLLLGGIGSTELQATEICDRTEIASADWEKVLEKEQCDFGGAQCTKEIQDSKEAIKNCLANMDAELLKVLACNTNAMTEFTSVEITKCRKYWWTSGLGSQFTGTRGNGFKDIFSRLIAVELRPFIEGTDFPNYGFAEKFAATMILENICGTSDFEKWGAVLVKLDDEAELTEVFLAMLDDDYIVSEDTAGLIEDLKAKDISTDARVKLWKKLGQELKKAGSVLMNICVAKDSGNKNRDVFKKLKQKAEELADLTCVNKYEEEMDEGTVMAASYVASAPQQQVVAAAGAPGSNNGGGNGAPASGGQGNGGGAGAPSYLGPQSNFAPSYWRK